MIAAMVIALGLVVVGNGTRRFRDGDAFRGCRGTLALRAATLTRRRRAGLARGFDFLTTVLPPLIT
jgi:hypothetical protein